MCLEKAPGYKMFWSSLNVPLISKSSMKEPSAIRNQISHLISQLARQGCVTISSASHQTGLVRSSWEGNSPDRRWVRWIMGGGNKTMSGMWLIEGQVQPCLKVLLQWLAAAWANCPMGYGVGGVGAIMGDLKFQEVYLRSNPENIPWEWRWTPGVGTAKNLKGFREILDKIWDWR